MSMSLMRAAQTRVAPMKPEECNTMRLLQHRARPIHGSRSSATSPRPLCTLNEQGSMGIDEQSTLCRLWPEGGTRASGGTGGSPVEG
eukprot:15467635-Alexandrium_andersonii.AAC.1